MPARIWFALCALAMVLAVGVSACQSTQEKSRELAVRARAAIKKAEAPIKITKQNPDVKVTGTTLLSDKNGTAVVVQLHNDSDQGQANVPILIDVKNAAGKTVFENATGGLTPTLNHLPSIGPGQTVTWVNDQILGAGGTSTSVKVGLGDPLPDTIPVLETTKPKLKNDTTSGLYATGDVANKSNQDLTDITTYGVAIKDGRVVAAGRGGIQRFKADQKPVAYNIYFIGNPTGADIQTSATVSIVK